MTTYNLEFTARDFMLYTKLQKKLPDIRWTCPCKFKSYSTFMLASQQKDYNVFVCLENKAVVAAYKGSEKLHEEIEC